MTKLIKKKDCKFKVPHIVKDDELIGIPKVVWLQLNQLETLYQQWQYLKDQPAYQEGPSLDGFVRKTNRTKNLPYVEMPKTPVNDARIEEAMAFMAEVDACAEVANVNEMIDRYAALISWCQHKKFIEGDCTYPIDTPELGNPLKLSANDVVKVLKAIVNEPIVIQG